MRRFFAYAWATPTTALGLLIVGPSILIGSAVSIRDGVIEAHGGLAAKFLKYLTSASLPGGAAALTLGHVVIGRDRESLERTRTHERVHVEQCERWGPFFVPAYLLSSAVAWLRGKNTYLDNRFEREAFAKQSRHPQLQK